MLFPMKEREHCSASLFRFKEEPSAKTKTDHCLDSTTQGIGIQGYFFFLPLPRRLIFRLR